MMEIKLHTWYKLTYTSTGEIVYLYTINKRYGRTQFQIHKNSSNWYYSLGQRNLVWEGLETELYTGTYFPKVEGGYKAIGAVLRSIFNDVKED